MEKVNILGTPYAVYKLAVADDDILSDEYHGYCDKTSKRIVVALPDETNELGDYKIYLDTLLRHEIIHAFLFESGLHENFRHPEYGHDETYVEWIAVQFPKILEVFKKLECI